LLRNTDRGTLTAEATIVHRGRTTLVVEVQVRDERARLIAKLVATLLAPMPAGNLASARAAAGAAG
jgi:acyl-coenzyme A thioesterase PaaI-like protein